LQSERAQQGTPARPLAWRPPPPSWPAAPSSPAESPRSAPGPAAGKSTFSQKLTQRSPGAWVRVNQDSIGAGGKRGSRQQCVRAAQRALASRQSVIVDRCGLAHDAPAAPWEHPPACAHPLAVSRGAMRSECVSPSPQATPARLSSRQAHATPAHHTACSPPSPPHPASCCRCNVDTSQRVDFMQLARRMGLRAHAIVLRLPVKLCTARAAQRTDHEGGVQGRGAARVVGQMHSQFVKAGGRQLFSEQQPGKAGACPPSQPQALSRAHPLLHTTSGPEPQGHTLLSTGLPQDSASTAFPSRMACMPRMRRDLNPKTLTLLTCRPATGQRRLFQPHAVRRRCGHCCGPGSLGRLRQRRRRRRRRR
jgi:hypothetical protein